MDKTKTILKTIEIGNTFVIKNLDNNEERKHYMAELVSEDVPTFDIGRGGHKLTYKKTTRVFPKMDDSVYKALTTTSSLGGEIYHKKLGDVIVDIDNNRWKIIEINDGYYKNIEQNVNTPQQSNVRKEIKSSSNKNQEVNKKRLLDIVLNKVNSNVQQNSDIIVIKRDCWTGDYCFVVEAFHYGYNGDIFFDGKTYKDGEIYREKEIIHSGAICEEYDGLSIQKIKCKYKNSTIYQEKKDIVELSQEYKRIEKKIDERIKNKMRNDKFIGYGLIHDGWKKKILKEKFGIDWKSTYELN